jgi:prepilin-type N-terminal cleavage/methylation domain-containing protein
MHRRRAFTLVEIMIVILIIGLLMSIAVPQFMKSRETTQLKACWENQQKLEAAKHMWMMDYGVSSGAAPVIADLVPEYIKVEPNCPTNAVYALGTGLASVTCPDHAAP